MRWMVGLVVLVICLNQALGQEEISTFEPPQTSSEEAQIYDQVVLHFNSDIQNFPSWEAFKTVVLSKMSSHTMGQCYEHTGQSVTITPVPFQGLEDGQWYETSDHGWRRLNKKDRTFVEYRINTKAGLLLRLEGVKPRFFFGSTKRICEFPL